MASGDERKQDQIMKASPDHRYWPRVCCHEKNGLTARGWGLGRWGSRPCHTSSSCHAMRMQCVFIYLIYCQYVLVYASTRTTYVQVKGNVLLFYFILQVLPTSRKVKSLPGGAPGAPWRMAQATQTRAVLRHNCRADHRTLSHIRIAKKRH